MPDDEKTEEVVEPEATETDTTEEVEENTEAVDFAKEAFKEDDAAGDGDETKDKSGDEAKPSEEDKDADDKDSSDKDQSTDEPTLSEAMLEKAAKFGLDKEDVAHLDSDEQVERLIGKMSLSGVEPKEKQVEEKTDEESETKTDKDAEGDAKNADEFDSDLGEDVAPEIRDKFNGLHKHYDNKFKQLTEKFDAMAGQFEQGQQSQMQAEQTAFVDDFESRIESLGKDFHDVLGEGSIEKIEVDSVHDKNRKALMQEVVTIQAGRKATEQEPLSTEDAFKRAVDSLYGDKKQGIATKAMSKKLSKRAKSTRSQRPSQRTTKNLTADESAINFAKEAFQEADE